MVGESGQPIQREFCGEISLVAPAGPANLHPVDMESELLTSEASTKPTARLRKGCDISLSVNLGKPNISSLSITYED